MARDLDPIIAELKLLRMLNGVRAVDVVAAEGMSLAALSHWENGHKTPHLHNLRAYARAVGYDLALVPLEEP